MFSMNMKRILAFILSLIIFVSSCFYNPVEVYAKGISLDLVNDLLDLKSNLKEAIGYDDIYDNDPLWNKLRNTVSDSLEKLGFPHYAATLLNPLTDPVLELKKMYAEKNNKDQDSVSNKEAASYMFNILNDCDIHDNNIIFSDDMNIFLKNVAQDYIDSNRVYYGYSCDLQYYVIPESGPVHNAIEDLKDLQNNYYCYIFTGFSPDRCQLTCIPKNDYSLVADTYEEPFHVGFRYHCQVYHNKTFSGPARNGNGTNEGVINRVYQGEEYNENYVIPNINGCCKAWLLDTKKSYRSDEYNMLGTSWWSGRYNIRFASYGAIYEQMIYGSYGLFTSSQRGMPPYVITNNWNNFINNEGDYTLNIDNSNHTSYEYLRTWIEQYFTDHDRYPTSEEINNYITNNNQTIINNYYITPTPTPGPGGTVSGNGSGGNTYVTNNYYVSGNVVPGSGNDPKTGKGIWDFLTELVSKLGDLINTIASSIGDVISALAALPGQIIDFFTIDGEQVSAALSEATVSMNNLKNEVIPSEQIKSTLAPLNISEIYYPKLTIKTPAIIRQYYDEEEIILLDFEKWAKYFVVVRSLLVFSFWFAFIYYTLASVRPHVDIGS